MVIKRRRARRDKSGPIGCLEAQKMIEPYLGGKLTEDELARFIEHMDHCRDCYDELNVFHTVYSALRDDPGQQELPYSLEEMISRSKAYLKKRKRYRSLQTFSGVAAFFAVIMLTAGLLSPDLPFSPRSVGEKIRGLFRGRHSEQVYEDIQTESETESVISEIMTEASS